MPLDLDIMGLDELRILPIPKRVLLDMWDTLDPSKKNYVEKKIGHLLSLLHIEPQVTLIKALAHFWNPETSTFVFDRHELTPTLEEIQIIIGDVPSLSVVDPSLGVDPVPRLSQILGVPPPEIRTLLNRNSKGLPLAFLEQRFHSFLSSPRAESTKVFLLAFFGFVIFPFTQKTMDPTVIHVIDGILVLKGFTNMILAEMFISLNRFKKDKRVALRAPLGILQVWFVSHLKQFGGNLAIPHVSKDINPLTQFKEIEKFLRPWTFHNWVDFLENLTPKQVLWQALWVHFPKVCLTSGHSDPIPLLGLTGSTSYYPLRAARQFYVLQEIPPPLKSGLFRFDFRNGVIKGDQLEELKNEMKRIIDLLYCYQPKDVERATDLEGSMKEHHASKEYIARRVEPELAVTIPKFPVIATPKETQMGRIIRERDEALAEAEHWQKAYKRVRNML
ncbi:uncharacterized protein LOC130138026 [Syzygium oleosum]|uniref:uncharacterized protein LOC130138026 n=1 Tax=Syzygium oleosum TaxID=219896 RepID=UPI0024BBD408|nr:uncharacterized protein LOC130138026 [Syzygium oleosum]